MTLTRYKVEIEYLGKNYRGFQLQKNYKTVASAINQAILNFSQENVKIFCSGRTDAGVHALGQVIHFDLHKKFRPYQIISAVNHHLRAEDIRFLDCEIVDQKFDARASAKARLYEYHILTRKTKPAVLRDLVFWHLGELSIDKMQEAANFLVGEHDFSSFRDSQCQAKHAIRRIDYIKLKQEGEKIIIYLKGNAFLHHMVRIIAGTLINIGSNKWDIEDMPKILAAKDRKQAGFTAGASGLFLTKIIY